MKILPARSLRYQDIQPAYELRVVSQRPTEQKAVEDNGLHIEILALELLPAVKDRATLPKARAWMPLKQERENPVTLNFTVPIRGQLPE